MEFIPTNDCFRHLLLLLRIHKDIELVLDIFEKQGVKNVTRSKVKSWSTKTGNQSPAYRPMPRKALDAFIDGLYSEKLIDLE